MWTCVFVVLAAACCGAAYAAVRPSGKPGMKIVVEAGEYVSRGNTVKVEQTTELTVYGPNRVFVKAEEHVLTEERPRAYLGGTPLAKTLGPVDTGTRLLYAICPELVKVHSTPEGGVVYEEGKDYFLDRDWGGMSRIDSGSIAKGQKVYIDYAVSLERVDLVQVSPNGRASIKQGSPAAVCPRIPDPDSGCTALASIYVPYRCRSITSDNICPMPADDIDWHRYIKVSGRDYLSRTLGLLREGKPVTIVCWGDSVTAGGSASSPDKTYVGLFEAQLRALYPKSTVKVINAGIGGSNTDSRRDGYDDEVLSYRPDLITVEFVNDVGKPADTIKANWAEFIARARRANPAVEFILITPHYVTPAWMSGFEAGVQAMRDAASDNKVALADTTNIWQHLRGIGIPYETLLANGLNHPNDFGHEFFAASLMELMRPSD